MLRKTAPHLTTRDSALRDTEREERFGQLQTACRSLTGLPFYADDAHRVNCARADCVPSSAGLSARRHGWRAKHVRPHRRRHSAAPTVRAPPPLCCDTGRRILSRQRAYCARWRGVKGPAQHLAQRTAAARHAAAAACALRNTALHWWLCRTCVVVGPPRHTLWRIAGASLVHRFHVAGMTLCWRGCPRRARLEPQCGACWG